MSQEIPLSMARAETAHAPAEAPTPSLRGSTWRPFVEPQLVKHGSMVALTNEFIGSGNPNG